MSQDKAGEFKKIDSAVSEAEVAAFSEDAEKLREFKAGVMKYVGEYRHKHGMPWSPTWHGEMTEQEQEELFGFYWGEGEIFLSEDPIHLDASLKVFEGAETQEAKTFLKIGDIWISKYPYACILVGELS